MPAGRLARFPRLTVARKLLLGFGSIIALLAITVAVGTIGSANQASISDRIVSHLDPARLAARDIVTLVRAIDDDGAWYVNALPGDTAHAAEMLRSYYAGVDQLKATIDETRTLADTDAQRAAVDKFVAFFWGTKPPTAAQLSTLDAQSHPIYTGADSYLFGNEQIFAEDRAGESAKASFDYTTVPFVPALDSAQAYIDEVQAEIDAAVARAAVDRRHRARVEHRAWDPRRPDRDRHRDGPREGHPRRPAGGRRGCRGDRPRGARPVVRTDRADEIGDLGRSFVAMISYLRSIAGAADAIAEGDLTVDVEPAGPDDALGTSFRTMTTTSAPSSGSCRRPPTR